MHAALQDLGRLGMTIQRLQVQPQPQQLLGEPRRESTAIGLHGFDVAAVHPQGTGLGWGRGGALGLQRRRHIDYDGRPFGLGGAVAGVLCHGNKRSRPNENQGQ